MKTAYERILVAVDDSSESKNALRKASEIAKMNNDAKLIITHVVDEAAYAGVQTFPVDFFKEAEERGKELLHDMESDMMDAGLTNIETILDRGNPKVLIPKEIAAAQKADLIVAGASGAGTVEKFVIGSVSAGIARHATSDVLIVRKKADGYPYVSILLAVDGSESAHRAFKKTIHLAKLEKAELTIAHVINKRMLSNVTKNSKEALQSMEDAGWKMLTEYKQEAESEGISPVRVEVEHGAPKMVLARSVAPRHHADLIVSGASGLRSRERFFLGSVSEGITRRAGCDVLVVRQPVQEETTL
ncbi:nucleotide-binding universal stress UspA family protein [Sinobaca qinghaiensis]|uniref:Nucleotide-binding universal stress UspA family protein n=2 Tax=Sinobaca qinghaiensis TaxID=342944 RepID=A0A419UWN1_9BACL|nr:nucleotide-binding universal stress UspA family protein [Sinobaca qinghaiensis]